MFRQVSDVVRLGEMEVQDEEDSVMPPSKVHFGCIMHQTGMFDAQVRGGGNLFAADVDRVMVLSLLMVVLSREPYR